MTVQIIITAPMMTTVMLMTMVIIAIMIKNDELR